MKKLFFIFCVSLLNVNSSFAQFNDDAIQKDLERIEKEFQHLFEDFGLDTESGIFVDTFFFKNLEEFQPGDGLMDFFNENLELTEMIDLLEQSSRHMESLDWSEFEKLFESFGLKAEPLVPAPDKLPGTGEDAKKSKSKRKSYSL